RFDSCTHRRLKSVSPTARRGLVGFVGEGGPVRRPGPHRTRTHGPARKRPAGVRLPRRYAPVLAALAPPPTPGAEPRGARTARGPPPRRAPCAGGPTGPPPPAGFDYLERFCEASLNDKEVRP